jgi:hypothetical protein
MNTWIENLAGIVTTAGGKLLLAAGGAGLSAVL